MEWEMARELDQNEVCGQKCVTRLGGRIRCPLYNKQPALKSLPQDDDGSLQEKEKSDDSGDGLTETSFISSSNTNEFLLHMYNEKDRGLIETLGLDQTQSVLDVHNPSETPRRQVDGFDGFMNHSCDPNTYSPLLSRADEMLCYPSTYQLYADLTSYKVDAARTILPVDHITCCDYNLLENQAANIPTVPATQGEFNCRGLITS
jgi:hypothetical protein